MIHMSDQWECTLCHRIFKADELHQHYRLFHPDHDIGWEAWPDGDPVVYDDLDNS
jgi:hypothetical protein